MVLSMVCIIFARQCLIIFPAENPCKVQLETKQGVLKEGEVVDFNCSTASSCPREPSITGLPESARLQQQRLGKSMTARLKVDWKDNRREVSCHVAPLQDSCLHHHVNVTLDVECKSSNITHSSIHHSLCRLTHHITLCRLTHHSTLSVD